MKSKKGIIFIMIGLLLMVVALSLVFYNFWDSARAEKVSLKTVTEIEKIIPDTPDNLISPEEYPDMQMPITKIDGYDYIGILEIPELNIKLPVMKDWDYYKLNISPCCYYGSAYKNNMVIAAHNYYSHFAGLGQLSVGSEIIFTDISGNKFNYNVIWTEIIQPEQIDQMIEEKSDDQWDLTLFTCTISGATRFTVRCAKSNDIN
ncbi:MAG: sortase [Acutalibacteraceae bacterium]|nr:sortase [Acutalibacteraceae bacterium]